MYITAQLIIDGALDEDVSYNTEDEFDSWLNEVKQQSEAFPDQEWQVFLIVHDHPLGDCMCVQYLTDHSPYWSNSHEW
jgi:hypothetical protein